MTSNEGKDKVLFCLFFFVSFRFGFSCLGNSGILDFLIFGWWLEGSREGRRGFKVCAGYCVCEAKRDRQFGTNWPWQEPPNLVTRGPVEIQASKWTDSRRRRGRGVWGQEIALAANNFISKQRQ
jgi:hypothetical protein